MRAGTRAIPAATAINSGWNTSRNCGTPKSNSPCNVDIPISTAPATWISASRRRRLDRSAGWARSASMKRIHIAIVHSEAPATIWMCGGLQRVTSWPKMRCHTSSMGKPASATTPQRRSRAPPTGTRRQRCRGGSSPPARSASAPSSIDTRPATARPSSPTRIGQWAAFPNTPSSRPWSMWVATSQ
jgi:hypothetical protein